MTNLADNHKPQLFPPNKESWELTENYIVVDETISEARNRAISNGYPPPSNGVTSLLTFFAKLIKANNVVEVGTAYGVSGLSFFSGMSEQGILTSIDEDTSVQLQARTVFTSAGLPRNRFRLIAGSPLEILPKLLDHAYDIFFINANKLEYVEYVDEAQRLLSPGGLLIIHDALWYNLIADKDNDDDETLIIREALDAVSNSDSFIPMLLPVGNGVLVAQKK